jgi:hypothetical protein
VSSDAHRSSGDQQHSRTREEIGAAPQDPAEHRASGCLGLDEGAGVVEQGNAHQIIYRLPKPRRDGRTAVALTPLEFIER